MYLAWYWLAGVCYAVLCAILGVSGTGCTDLLQADLPVSELQLLIRLSSLHENRKYSFLL